MTLHCKLISRILVSAGFLLISSRVWATPIVNSSLVGSPGAFSYSYEVENQTAVGLLLFSVTVSGDVGTIDSPSGWLGGDFTDLGGTNVEWVSTDAAFDIPAFGGLSGFGFTSTDGLGPASFSTLDENFSEFDGQTIGPIAPGAPDVPEPASLVLLGTGLTRCLARWRKRQPQSASRG
jgi:hypothetical protein